MWVAELVSGRAFNGERGQDWSGHRGGYLAGNAGVWIEHPTRWVVTNGKANDCGPLFCQAAVEDPAIRAGGVSEVGAFFDNGQGGATGDLTHQDC